MVREKWLWRFLEAHVELKKNYEKLGVFESFWGGIFKIINNTKIVKAGYLYIP